MANEIKVQASIQIDNVNFALPKYGNSIQQISQAAPGGGIPGTVTVPVADTAIDLSAIATLGWVFIRNIDAVNYVRWGPDSGGALDPMGRILPGEEIVFRLEPGVTLRMFANTAPVKVDVVANEN